MGNVVLMVCVDRHQFPADTMLTVVLGVRLVRCCAVSGEVLARTEISLDGEGEPRATYTVTARIIILHKMGSDVSCFNISSVARLRGKVTQTVPRNHNF